MMYSIQLLVNLIAVRHVVSFHANCKVGNIE